MKLLVLTTQDRFFLTHIRDRIAYFQAKGWEVCVVVQKTDQKLFDEIQELGVQLFDSKIRRGSINPFFELISLCRLLRIYYISKPDIVWHLGAKSIFYGTAITLFLRMFRRIGVVNAPIGMGYVFASTDFKAKLLRPLFRLLYRFLLNPAHSKVIVENVDDIQAFISSRMLQPGDAHCVLGAGIDTSVFKPREHDNAICTVLMASRLIYEKGVWDFVKVAEDLYKKKVPVKMVLVGEPDSGNPSSLTNEDVEVLRQNPALVYLGYREDMVRLLQMSDVFCLPSFYREGLPRALIEATSCGLPVITTNTIGCKEVVRMQNGFLFNPRDYKELSYLVETLVKNPSLRKKMGEKSREVAVKFFDINVINKQTYSIFYALYQNIFQTH